MHISFPSVELFLVVNLFLGLISADWIQPFQNSHRANIQLSSSSEKEWSTTFSRLTSIDEVIIDQKQVIVVSTGWGFCYAPTYFFIDRDTGVLDQSLSFHCNIDKSNAISTVAGGISVINNDYPRSNSFVINENGYVPGFNQTGFVKQLFSIGKNRVVFNFKDERFSVHKWELKAVDLDTKVVMWNLDNITCGAAVIDDDLKMYAMSADLDELVIIDTQNGDVLDIIKFYSPVKPYGSLMVPNQGPKNIYSLQYENDDLRIYAYAVGNKGALWVSKPFNTFPSAAAIDNTGQYIVILDSSANELSLIRATTGKSVLVKTEVQFSSLIGITDKNEVALINLNHIDFVSIPDGRLIKSVSVDHTSNCALDKTAVYCCDIHGCTKTLI